jgi:ketosteroid isomerase-like protein
MIIESTSATATDMFLNAMKANNAEWIAAFNNKDAQALGKMYDKNALLLGLTNIPIRGAQAIQAFWAQTVAKCHDHTWTILDAGQEKTLGYQVAEWTVVRTTDEGEQSVSGNTVRVLKEQPDGHWITKVHMVTRHT